MKKILTLSILLCSFFAHGQQNSRIVVSYGFGNGQLGSLGKSGSPFSHKQKSLNIFGLNYWHPISKHLFFETGMQFIRYNYLTTSFFPNYSPTNNTLNIVSVPFKLRVEAGKFFFFNGGLTADLSRSKPDPMAGIGAGIGVGLQIKTIKNISLYVNPQANIHGMLPGGRFFAESTISFGASFQFPNP